MKQHPPFALSIALFALVGFGCNGQVSDDELDVGEGAAYLGTAEDEEGDPAADGIAELDDTTIDGLADEESRGEDDRDIERPSCDRQERRDRVRDHYDADRDGRLSQAERDELRADLDERTADRSRLGRLVHRIRHRRFALVRRAFDANRDGVLDREERASLVDAMEARCEERRARILREIDTDGDGTLSDAEREVAREAHRARRAVRRAALLERYDADRDGRLSETERTTLRRDIAARLRTFRGRVLAAFDADGDGVLSQAELDRLFAAIRDRLAQDDDARPDAERPTDVTREPAPTTTDRPADGTVPTRPGR